MEIAQKKAQQKHLIWYRNAFLQTKTHPISEPHFMKIHFNIMHNLKNLNLCHLRIISLQLGLKKVEHAFVRFSSNFS